MSKDDSILFFHINGALSNRRMALRKISDEVYCGTNSEHYFLAENREPGRCALLNVFNLNENTSNVCAKRPYFNNKILKVFFLNINGFLFLYFRADC